MDDWTVNPLKLRFIVGKLILVLDRVNAGRRAALVNKVIEVKIE